MLPSPHGRGDGGEVGVWWSFFVSGEGFAGWMEQKKGGAYRAYGPDSTAQAARIAAGNRAIPEPVLPQAIGRSRRRMPKA